MINPRTIAAMLAFALHSITAAASPSSGEIQAAIDEAAKAYRGDFPPGATVQISRPYKPPGKVLDIEVRLSLAVTRPALSEMLVCRPSFIESFGSP